jgi:hypothetical protein
MFNKIIKKMKTILLTVFALVLCITLSAQKGAKVPADKANIMMQGKIIPTLLEPEMKSPLPYQPGDGPRTPGVNEAQIGQTVYDLQTNSGIQNRMYVYPDGTIGAVWTMGFVGEAGGVGFADRGTGYNYFDGNAWGEWPTARIASETTKNGWPSYAPLGDGEMVISHTGSGMLNFTRRATKGTGTWTTTGIPGTTGYTWPRAITVGNTIHVIVNTGAAYQGLTNAMLYLRSTDAGATWSTPVIPPGLDAASLPLTTAFAGFGGDEYAWAAPKGDTIAFAVGHFLGGIWLMKSFDGGDTWTKTTVYQFPVTSGAESPQIATFDEGFAIALDNQGQVHMATTRYLISSFNTDAQTWNYFPYASDGIIYWNESMPKIDTAILYYEDSLKAHGMWVGGMIDYNGNDVIDFPEVASGSVPWGDYRYINLSSHPQIVCDKDNNMFISYSALREDLTNAGANPTEQLYRHLYVSSKLNTQTAWREPIDLTDDVIHSYDEVVWAYMVVGHDGNVHFLCQMDAEPGTSVGDDADQPGDNYITYLTFPTFVSVKPVDIAKDVTVSPNPASEYANVQVMLNNSGKVEVNVYDVMGKLVLANNYGQQSTGSHTYKINTSSLPSGVYVFNVQAGDSQTSKKVIVK